MAQRDTDFYLGKVVDPDTGKLSEQKLLYDPDDLTTHAVVVGMTGSGKTGLCLDLLEEAALKGLPALMIDPKGDIGNALLHFPSLQPDDLKPWINADQARREGKSQEQAANDTARLWRKGLAEWGIGPKRIQALKDSVQFTVYTPGSDAGLPVSILASLKAPEINWTGNQELLRERISSTVSALLGLIGMSAIDPVQSQEHILLSNIFEQAWSQGKDLDLAELILQTQSPPFDKLGVFDVNTFFPEKERFQLAMKLNNILAAPTFQAWIDGQPLNIQELLYTEEGKPRHSIFYIAHLSDEERMFFVSLLFSSVETWMRSQKGSGSLRALIYFDEIFGFLPPVGNPPSKESMLRMLKQARAFGVGLILATQNPVDVDYKALSNAGSWFIGKLQTDQDKQRLLDGLIGAAGDLDKSYYDDLLSRIEKRQFLLHNIHAGEPQLFKTRWAMNYLAGPLTREQIPALNALAGVSPMTWTAAVEKQRQPGPIEKEEQEARQAQTAQEEPAGSETRPTVPRDVAEYFLVNNLSLSEAARSGQRDLSRSIRSAGLRYRPVLLAQADVGFANRKYNLMHNERYGAVVQEPDRRGMIRWEDYLGTELAADDVDRQPAPNARFAELDEPLVDAKIMRSMERDFAEWCYQNAQVAVKANEELGVYAGPDVSEEAFREMCEAAAADELEEASEKLASRYEQKIDRIEERLRREERELKEDEAEYSMRKGEEGVKHVETLLGFLGGRRRSLSSSMTKRRMTEKAKADVEESVEAIEAFEKEIKELEEELASAEEELKTHWQEVTADTTEIAVKPYKKDIRIEYFGVAWFPYLLVREEEDLIELPGFASAVGD